MTAKSVELEGGKSSEKSANNNDDYSECSEDFATRIKGCSQDNLAVNYNGQNVPMILVEKASLVSAFPYAPEDPVYTPPTDNSTTSPGCSMDESLPSLLKHQKSTVSFKERTKCPKKKKGPWYIPSVTCIPIIVIVILIGMVVMVPIILDNQKYIQKQREGRTKCTDTCHAILAESIPMNLTYPDGSPSHPSIYSNLMMLLKSAKKSIKIASSYWSLRNSDVSDLGTNTSWEGERLFQEIYKAGKIRGIKIQIAQDKPNRHQPDDDTELLSREKAAEVRSLDFKCLLGAGILHTKMWLVDDEHFYLGSANMDWRSLTQVKEIGIIVTNCSCMANDLAKIFDVYWEMGGIVNGSLPKHWPARDKTRINSTSPLEVYLNGTSKSLTYFSSSPPPLSPEGREEDIDAILDVIKYAKKFVHVAVMDFVPAFLYGKPKYWPVINDALKVAAIDRRVEVKILMSNWTHTRPDIVRFLKSFQAVDGAFGADVKIRLFTVPAFDEKQAKIEFARVNHNKYMVTDNCAYIGTSNWSADYFVNTGGIGIVVNQSLHTGDLLGNSSNLRSQLADIFQRDWDSDYAGPLPE